MRALLLSRSSAFTPRGVSRSRSTMSMLLSSSLRAKMAVAAIMIEFISRSFRPGRFRGSRDTPAPCLRSHLRRDRR
jgi:hypothetical protein